MGTMVDFNCDLGEGSRACAIGDDDGKMPVITSANLACGVHGDAPLAKGRAVGPAGECGVQVGARLRFPDPVGFARREMRLLGRIPTEAVIDVLDGAEVRMSAHQICLHGDPPGTPGLMSAMREGLNRAGLQAIPTGRWV